METPPSTVSRYYWLLAIPLVVAISGGIVSEYYKVTYISPRSAPPAVAPAPAPAPTVPAPPIVEPKVTPQPAIEPAPPKRSLVPFKPDYVGETTRFNSETGREVDVGRVWHLKMRESGTFDGIFIYHLDQQAYELVLVGSFQDENTFVGRTKQVGGIASYTPDDITLVFSNDRNTVLLNWDDPHRKRYGYAKMQYCEDASTFSGIFGCSGPRIQRLVALKRRLKGVIYAGDTRLREAPLDDKGNPYLLGCRRFFKWNSEAERSEFERLECN